MPGGDYEILHHSRAAAPARADALTGRRAGLSHGQTMWIRHRQSVLQGTLFRLRLCIIALAALVPAQTLAQEALLEILPIRPFNFDVALRQQSFAPNDREVTPAT